jgi:hypothetical protein
MAALGSSCATSGMLVKVQSVTVIYLETLLNRYPGGSSWESVWLWGGQRTNFDWGGYALQEITWLRAFASLTGRRQPPIILSHDGYTVGTP